MTKEKALTSVPEYYKSYIHLVPSDGELITQLENGGIAPYVDTVALLENLGDKVYEVGKWTIKEILQHLIDVERILMTRALRFVRQDNTALPGFDHDAYVVTARVDHLTVQELLQAYQVLRLSTVLFFKNLSEDELMRSGTANNVSLSVLGIGYILIGHPLHHFNVIEERYMSL
jgi:hypothetical protein